MLLHLEDSSACLYRLCCLALCVLFGACVFPLFVYELLRLTMPLCVLSCAYCCCCVSVPSLASTRCRVETITTNSAMCLHWPDPVALPVAFTTFPILPLDL